MKPWSQVTVLLLTAIFLLGVGLTDLHMRYIKPSFAPMLIGAGVIVGLLAITTGRWAILSERDDAEEAHNHAAYDDHDSDFAGNVYVDEYGNEQYDDEQHRYDWDDAGSYDTERQEFDHHPEDDAPLVHAHGHDHGGNGPAVGWALLLPVAVVALISPPALGADAAQRQITSAGPRVVETPAGGYEVSPLPEGDPSEVNVAIFQEHAWFGNKEDLAQRDVAMTGFVVPAEDGDGWYVARMTIACCAADALAIRVKITGQPAPPTDSWVRVVGKYVPEENPSSNVDDLQPPTLNVTSIEQVAPEEPPYL